MTLKLIIISTISLIILVILVRVLINIKSINDQYKDPFKIYIDALWYIKTGKIEDYPIPMGRGCFSHNSSTWLTCPYCQSWKGSLGIFKKECGGCHTPTTYFFNSQVGTFMDIFIWLLVSPKSESSRIRKSKELRESRKKRNLLVKKYAHEILINESAPRSLSEYSFSKNVTLYY